MNRRLFALASVLALSLGTAAVAVADDPAASQALFKNAAFIQVPPGASPFASLALPPAVFTTVKPDLSDLRIFAGGQEIPFVLDGGGLANRGAVVRVPAAVVDVTRNKGEGTVSEVYVLSMPDAVKATDGWSLVVVSSRDNYARSVKAYGTVGPSDPDSVGSIFSLSRGAVHNDRIPVLTEGAKGNLQVELAGSDTAYLEPTFAFERWENAVSVPTMRVPLKIIAERTEGRITYVECERPVGLVPSALEVTVPGDQALDRGMTVYDGDRRGAVLGMGRLFRVPGEDDGDRHTGIALGRPSAKTLTLAVGNHDSPALPSFTVMAEVEAPRILFVPPAEGPITLFFGGGHANRREYDIAQLRPMLAAGGKGTDFRIATVEEIRDNPLYSHVKRNVVAARAGKVVDAKAFQWRAEFAVADGTDGPTSVALTAAQVAKARPALEDLRVVDPKDRQWPYVLDRDLPATDVKANAKLTGTKGAESTFVITPESAPLPLMGVTLEVADLLFERRYKLVGVDEKGTETTIQEGFLARQKREETGAPPPVQIDIHEARAVHLRLSVTDGDNAPLRITSAKVQAKLPTVRFMAPAGSYALLFGNATVASPNYDLTILSTSSDPSPVIAAAVIKNPVYGPAAPPPTKDTNRTLLWIVLVAAVLVLAGVTLRSVRKEA